MTDPSDRPPPYIPRWGQQHDEPHSGLPDVRNGPFGFDEPAGDERYPHGGTGRLPLPRSLDPTPVPEWPREGVQTPKRGGFAGKALRYFLTFGLAAGTTLALVLMLNTTAVQDLRTQQSAAGNSFTTRFGGEGQSRSKTEPAQAGRDRTASLVPQAAGIAPRTATPDMPTPKTDPAPSNLTSVPKPASRPVSKPAWPSTPPVASPSAKLQPAPAPAQPPPPPARSPLGREEIDILFTQGESFVAAGDFASARMVFRRAAESGDARAALALGATYDPILLGRMGARGIAPDVAQARQWYTRAREYGSSEAAGRLQALADAR